MASAPRPSPSKILELESLRGLAALLVFLHHVPAWNAAVHGLPVLRNGQLMVELFFVLSGYVIFLTYGERIRSAADIARFQFLRFGRLYPVHLAVLLGYLALEVVKYLAQQRLGIAFGRPAFEQFSLANVAANLTLTHALGLFPDLPPINGPSWSISVEFYVYLLFALIGAFLYRARTLAYALLAATALALVIADSGNEMPGRFQDPLLGIAGFFLGALVAIGSVRLRKADFVVPGWGLALAALALLAFLTFKPQHRQLNALIFPLSMLLIVATVHGEPGRLKGLLTWRPIVWLGTISYSLYMVHLLVLWSVRNALRYVFKVGAGPDDPLLTAEFSTAGSIAVYAITIALTLLASYLLYRFVERPLRERSRRVVGAGVGAGHG